MAEYKRKNVKKLKAVKPKALLRIIIRYRLSLIASRILPRK